MKPSRAIPTAISFQLSGCSSKGCRCRLTKGSSAKVHQSKSAKGLNQRSFSNFIPKSSAQDDTPPLEKKASDAAEVEEKEPVLSESELKSQEFYEKLPSFVKGDSIVEGTDIRLIDVTSAIGFAIIGVYVFRNYLF
eukprot:CAMPEP_0118934998 /NCGR_PEP_ID=MMETSP1169-20130426/14687_1 /TAXON_ID=36882 /ORGANISM="Pyramimonas obovata, Strain CCMP722" /LENGTH=135 /DNA_ID=CAMNT_0006877975 /DNA_START=44 /DNA_END=451 /DNA_ORIENTATION=+